MLGLMHAQELVAILFLAAVATNRAFEAAMPVVELISDG